MNAMENLLATQCRERWRACRQPVGELGGTLALGPLQLRLEGLDEHDVDLLSRRWGKFFTHPAPAGKSVRICVYEGGTEAWLGDWEPGERYRLETYPLDAGSALTLSYRFGLAREEDGVWSLAVARGGDEPRERTLENAIRFLVARVAIEAGGFAFHGAGLLHEGRAVMFAGASGAGKSTAMRNSRPRPSLGDDYAVVLPDGEGGWIAPALPFDNAERAPEPPEGGPFPLAAIYRLTQAKIDRVSKLGALEATRALMQSIVLPWAMPDLQPRLLQQLDTFLCDVHVADLELRDDPGFWGPLKEDLSATGR